MRHAAYLQLGDIGQDLLCRASQPACRRTALCIGSGKPRGGFRRPAERRKQVSLAVAPCADEHGQIGQVGQPRSASRGKRGRRDAQ